ncbi:uracil-DNA glycosylase [Bacillus dakarensis]|uniref:uracil-DNA glycosylase n=1 Tax=Robertmurraya dakarensis TaxID=1926278 RepID=UPI001F2396C4|nr:uracil-DNA glycosylase [Bacillus dakarensis]
MIKAAKSCVLCEAMKHSEAVLSYENGNLESDIMFVAEAPGPKGADVTGIPLHGDATGNNFEKLLAATNWDRSDVFVTNAVLCCPTNEQGNVRKPTKQEVHNCHTYLAKIIDLVNPKVVVPLGKKALEALNEIESHELILKKDVATYRKWNNRYIYPLYHPSPQVMNMGTRTFQQQRTDFKQLKHNYRARILKGLEPLNFSNNEE